MHRAWSRMSAFCTRVGSANTASLCCCRHLLLRFRISRPEERAVRGTEAPLDNILIVNGRELLDERCPHLRARLRDRDEPLGCPVAHTPRCCRAPRTHHAAASRPEAQLNTAPCGRFGILQVLLLPGRIEPGGKCRAAPASTRNVVLGEDLKREGRRVVGRYASLIAAPTEAQTNLLSRIITVKFPSRVKTVGAATRHLLRGSGYRLAGESAADPARFDLLNFPLPTAHRSLGPMPLQDALETLGGPVPPGGRSAPPTGVIRALRPA